MRTKLPTTKQVTFKVSVSQKLLPWWEKTVEPAIKKSGLTRTAFIMQAVREKVERG